MRLRVAVNRMKYFKTASILKPRTLFRLSQELEKEEVVIYWDYRDSLSEEQIKLIEEKGSEAFFEIENELWDFNLDYIYELQYEKLKEKLTELEYSDFKKTFLENAKKEAEKEAEKHIPWLFNDLDDKDELLEYIKAGFYNKILDELRIYLEEYINVNLNLEQLINNTYYEKYFQIYIYASEFNRELIKEYGINIDIDCIEYSFAVNSIGELIETIDKMNNSTHVEIEFSLDNEITGNSDMYIVTIPVKDIVVSDYLDDADIEASEAKFLNLETEIREKERILEEILSNAPIIGETAEQETAKVLFTLPLPINDGAEYSEMYIIECELDQSSQEFILFGYINGEWREKVVKKEYLFEHAHPCNDCIITADCEIKTAA